VKKVLVRSQKATPARAPLRRRRQVALRPSKAAEPRTYKLGVGAIGAITFVAALLLAWGGSVTWLLFAGNTLATSAVSRSIELQEQHEQRVLDLRQQIEAFEAEVARLTREAEFARVDRGSDSAGEGSSLGGVERKVIEIARRQGQLEARQQALSRLTEQAGAALTQSFAVPVGASAPVPAAAASQPSAPQAFRPRPQRRTPAAAASAGGTGGVLPQGAGRAAPGQPAAAPAAAPQRPPPQFFAPGAPVPDSTVGRVPAPTGPARGLGPVSRLPADPLVLPAQADAGPTPDDVTRLEARVRTLEQQQMKSVEVFERSTRRYASLLQQSMDVAGRQLAGVVEQPRAQRAARNQIQIGLPPSEERTAFGLALREMRGHLATIQRLRPSVESLPLARPVSEGFRTSSPFGPRFHPIYAVERLHAGQDFAAPIGTPTRATGSGVVLSAGWAGGYGWLIQIDHGQGLVTRYAHLSEMLVTPGQPVALGQVVGLVGNTGGSTGPHLHYETRVEDEPVDPVRFLTIGEQLGLRTR
jgi:murein DD-endopeptidase MepM/ murein hydrolase activator NlpD